MPDPDPHFLRAFALVMEREGPISDDPSDDGGYTRWGIALNRHPELTRARLEAMTREEARDEVYRPQYWDIQRCGEMPWPIALIAFDSCVNQGRRAIGEIIQRACGVDVDGKIGPRTIRAINAAPNLSDLAAEIQWLRAEAYRSSSRWARFGHGWIRRTYLIHHDAFVTD